MLKAGIIVVLDKWENMTGDSLSRLVSRAAATNFVIAVGTPLYFKKFENKLSTTGSVVAAEVDLISDRLLGTEDKKRTVLPLLLAGDKESSLPPLMRGRINADFRDEERYFLTAFDLVLSLYGIAPNDAAVSDLRESLDAAFIPGTLRRRM